MENLQKSKYETYIQNYFNYIELRNYSQKTINEYRYDLNTFITFIIKYHPEIKNLDDEHIISIIEEFLLYLKKDKNNCPATINRKLFCIRSFFNFLSRRSIIKENYASKIEAIQVSKNKRHIYLSLRQAHQLQNYCEKSQGPFAIRNEIMIRLMLELGLRVSEVAELNIESIDFENNELQVRGKGNKYRYLPLPHHLKNKIKTYIQSFNKSELAVSPLFLSRNNRRISTRMIQKITSYYIKEAGLPDNITCHKLRHTFGTLAVQDFETPVSIVTLQQIMGHSSITTTRLYAEASNKQIKTGIINHPLNR